MNTLSISNMQSQKRQATKQGYNQLAQLSSARNAQNKNIRQTRQQQRVGGAVSGAMLGAQMGGPMGAVAGSALALLFG